MEHYHKLPKFTGPNMLPEINMTHIMNNIRPNMAYCNFIFVPKLKPWCNYIKQYDARKLAEKVRTSNIGEIVSNGSKIFGNQYAVGATTDDPCFDQFYCASAQTAKLQHLAMIFCLVAAIIGVVGQIICLPAFNSHRNRSGTSWYLTVIGLLDIVFLGLGSVIYIARGVPSTYDDQLKLYKAFSVYLVPFGVPIMELAFVCITWIMVAMIIDRYWFHIDSKYSSVTSRCRYFRNTAVIIFIMTLYSAPKFVNFTTLKDEDAKVPSTRAVYFFGELPIYQTLIKNWGKMLIELVLPGVLISVFITLVTNRCAVFPPHTDIEGNGGDTLARYRSREASNTSLTIWICSLLGLVLAIKVICHFILLCKLETAILRDVIINGEFFISVLFIAVRPFVYVGCSHSIRRYILFGWLCRNTPPPQPITDVPYTKCGLDSNSSESDPLKESA